MSVPSQRNPRTRRKATAMTDVIAEVRERLGRDERFRAATKDVSTGRIVPLIASFDGTKVVYQRRAKAEGAIAVVTSRKEDGSIREADVGEGSRVTVEEELLVKTGGVEAVFDATTTTLHTLQRIGDQTTVRREGTNGSLTIKERDKITTTCDPRRARRLTKELF